VDIDSMSPHFKTMTDDMKSMFDYIEAK
ncbi:MAG: hypothetical protein ACI9EQ_001782, partial [Bacteroidia bacterium]